MKILSVKDLEKISKKFSKKLYVPEGVKVNVGMALQERRRPWKGRCKNTPPATPSKSGRRAASVSAKKSLW